jgi:hypothetical protein
MMAMSGSGLVAGPRTNAKHGRKMEYYPTNMKLKIERAFLVYQAGIANVFQVDCFNLSNHGREAKRLMQGDFRTCETFSRGLGKAGTLVASAVCNEAGDIKDSQWSEDFESAPFRESFSPVYCNVADPR